MGRDGYSLIEMMIVVALMGILLAMATLSFNDYMRKARIESQTKTLYSDIVNVRSEAMFRRAGRLTTIKKTLFSVYSTNLLVGPPIKTTRLSNAVDITAYIGFDDTIRFNERGLLVDSEGHLLDQDHSIYICVSESNSAGLDSIIIGTANIQMGKSNGTCDQPFITPK